MYMFTCVCVCVHVHVHMRVRACVCVRGCVCVRECVTNWGGNKVGIKLGEKHWCVYILFCITAGTATGAGVIISLHLSPHPQTTSTSTTTSNYSSKNHFFVNQLHHIYHQSRPKAAYIGTESKHGLWVSGFIITCASVKIDSTYWFSRSKEQLKFLPR